MNYEYWQLVEMKERIEAREENFRIEVITNIIENMEAEIEEQFGSAKYLDMCVQLKQVAEDYLADNF